MKILNKKKILRLLLVSWAAGLSLITGQAQENSPSPAPLFDDMGNHRHKVTTGSKLAQRYFDQGLTLLFGFNHEEAIRSFEAAAQIDPYCAMAYWGIAYAYGPNINAPMTETAVPKAWAALQKAVQLKPTVSEKERAYIEAIETRYQPEPVEDRSRLDQAYADAMRELVKKYPDDLDAATLFAEALMDTIPWNYWTEDKQPRPATTELLAALESVLQRDRGHPGANHFYIHAVEAGPSPVDGLPSANRLGRLVPDSGHLVHMPSHIFLRVGQYHKASEANEKAVQVDEDYIAACRAQGFYPGVYYPHNAQFLWYTYSMEGRGRECIEESYKVSQYAYDNVCGPAQVVEAPRFRHLPLLTMARFGKWEDILAAPVPAGGFLFDKAMWHYARGLARIAKEDAAEAAEEMNALESLAAGEEAGNIDTPYFPGTQMLKVARHALRAKLHGLQGEPEAMLREFDRAIEAEFALPYMEPPYWYYPVQLSKGAALLRLNRFAEAEATFQDNLKHHPNNGWALHGLERALTEQEKKKEARKAAREFRRAWKHADAGPNLEWY